MCYFYIPQKHCQGNPQRKTKKLWLLRLLWLHIFTEQTTAAHYLLPGLRDKCHKQSHLKLFETICLFNLIFFKGKVVSGFQMKTQHFLPLSVMIFHLQNGLWTGDRCENSMTDGMLGTRQGKFYSFDLWLEGLCRRGLKSGVMGSVWAHMTTSREEAEGKTLEGWICFVQSQKCDPCIGTKLPLSLEDPKPTPGL